MRAVHNRGEFQDLTPNGKKIAVGGISIEHLKDGKIVERRVSSGWQGMMQQLGLIPPGQSAGYDQSGLDVAVGAVDGHRAQCLLGATLGGPTGDCAAGCGAADPGSWDGRLNFFSGSS